MVSTASNQIANHGEIHAGMLVEDDVVVLDGSVATVMGVRRGRRNAVLVKFDVADIVSDADQIDGPWPVTHRTVEREVASTQAFHLIQMRHSG